MRRERIPPRRRAAPAALLLASAVLLGAPHIRDALRACDEPVFKWALSHWGAWDAEECYQLTVFHRGELGAGPRSALEALKERGWPKEGGANVVARSVDLEGGELDEATKALWEAQKASQTRPETAPETASETPSEIGPQPGSETGPQPGSEAESRAESRIEPQLPWAVVTYPPPSRIPVSAWSGPFGEEAEGIVKEIADSPLRRKVAREILEGDAAVWVLLECGDAEKDAAARKLIDETLRKLEKEMELPQPVEETWGYWEIAPDAGSPGGSAASGDATGGAATAEKESEEPGGLHPSFSLERVARDAQAERFLIRMMLRTEPDLELAVKTEPVAFPVFGRGRVLYALVGKGINEENVTEACGYIVGRCSCEFKWMNPGVDLLLAANWDSVPATPSISTPKLLDLVSPPSRGETHETAPAETATDGPFAEEARPVPAIAPGGPDGAAGAAEGTVAPGVKAGEADDPGDGRSALLRNVGIAVGGIALVLIASAVALRRRLSRM